MKTSKIAVSLILTIAILLLASCNISSPPGSVSTTRPDDEHKPASSLDIYVGGATEYSLLVSAEQSEAYAGALEYLLAAFKEAFGASPAVIGYSAETELAESQKLIILGNIGADRPAELRAAELLAGAGYCVCPGDRDLAIYATSDNYLTDAVMEFSDVCIKTGSDGLTIKPDFCLRHYVSPAAEDSASRGLTYPVLSIDTEGGRAVTSKTNYIPASVTLENTDSEYLLESVSAQIRGRGNGTWKDIKKQPYKLKFDKKINLMGVGHAADKDWLLLSNPLDFTNMRNAITFNIANTLLKNIAYCSNYTFVNVYLNGNYRGIYMLCEQNEANSHKVLINEDPASVSGSDYFVQLDYYAQSDGSLKKNVDYFELEGKYFRIESDYNSTERCMYVLSVYAKFFEAVRSGDRAAVEACVDLPSAVDTYILNEFMKNTDVGWSSFFMVVRAPGVIEFTAPWDFDLSSGNDYRIDDFSAQGLYVGRSTDIQKQSSPIFYLLMQNDWFVRLVCERMDEIGDDLLNVALATVEKELPEHRTDFENDMAQRLLEPNNYSKPEANKNHSSASDPPTVLDDNMNRLTGWLRVRYEWLSAYFASIGAY